MKKYSTLLGSTALAMILFTGCGDSNDGETAVTPTTVDQEAALAEATATAQSSLRSTSNTLLRAQAKSSNVESADVFLTLALENFSDKKAFPIVVDARATITRYMDASDLEAWNALTAEEQNAMIIAAYLDADDTYGDSSAPALRGFGSLFDKVKKTVKKVVDPINDKIIKPVVKKIDDEIIDPIEEKIIEPIVDKIDDEIVDPVKEKIIDPVAEKVQEEIFDPINEKVLDPIKEDVIEPLLDGELVENIGDEIKRGIENIVEIDLITDLTASAFKIMLESDGITNTMLDMAIGSDTMTNIMITVMEDNWDLANKMAPMLRDAGNIEFGEKFMELALKRPKMAHFLFTYIDANMYDALADAMIISSDAYKAGTLGHEEYTTTTMGTMMAMYATTYFVIPDTSSVAQGQNARFPSLMFNSGSTARGDANELINEKFFYALFKMPASTESFVDAMDQLDQDTTRTAYMDLFFMGQNPVEDAAEATDVNQSYNNIIAIAGGMYAGIYGSTNENGETLAPGYGLTAYTKSFAGFAGLVPTDKYVPYGKSFMGAGYYWAEQNGYSILGEAGSLAYNLIEGWLNPVEDETELRGLFDPQEPWVDTLITALYDAYDNVSLGDLWDTGWSQYIDGNESADIFAELNVQVVAAYTAAEVSFRTTFNAELNDDLSNAGVAEVTLPSFFDLNVSYVYTETKDRVVTYAEGIDSQWLAEFSDSNFSSEYIYPYFQVNLDNNESLAYIPNWMTQLDWLKLPFIYTESNYDDYGLDFETGSVSLFIVSDYDNASEYLTDNTSLVWTQVDDAPLTTDETRILYTYTASINVYDLVNFNLNDTINAVQDKVTAVAVSVGLAEDVTVDNNTTTVN